MTENNSKYLLPIGFYDLLSKEAEVNQRSIDILLKKFHDYGYNLIKTPLVEFAKIIADNSKISDQSFKMIDIFSGKDLIIRSDITTQIARVFNTKLVKENLPLRLCYAGDVLKVKNDDLYADRQLTQAGIELIGSESLNANQEVINIILEGLNNIKLPNLIIDFCLPQFLDELLAELKLKETEKLKLAIAQKNISQIRILAEKYAQNLVNLTLQINDFKAINAELKNLPISKSAKEKINNLQKIVDNLSINYPDLKILVNIFGDADFLYHQQIGFTIFEEGFSYPVARGGCYQINSQIPAVGATIYINNLRKILIKTPNQVKKTILIGNDLTTNQINKLHAQGYITINCLKDNPDQKYLKSNAPKFSCNYIYTNDKPEKI